MPRKKNLNKRVVTNKNPYKTDAGLRSSILMWELGLYGGALRVNIKT